LSQIHDAYIRKADEIRGRVISHTILLERSMDILISEYFSKDGDKKKELITLIFAGEKISFYKKVDIFKYILKRFVPDEKKFEERFPDFKSEFDKIAGKRNRFAHDQLLTGLSDNLAQKLAIGLIHYKNIEGSLMLLDHDIEEIIGRLLKWTERIQSATLDFFGKGSHPDEQPDASS
jgi:hypothetical protein